MPRRFVRHAPANEISRASPWIQGRRSKQLSFHFFVAVCFNVAVLQKNCAARGASWRKRWAAASPVLTSILSAAGGFFFPEPIVSGANIFASYFTDDGSGSQPQTTKVIDTTGGNVQQFDNTRMRGGLNTVTGAVANQQNVPLLGVLTTGVDDDHPAGTGIEEIVLSTRAILPVSAGATAVPYVLADYRVQPFSSFGTLITATSGKGTVPGSSNYDAFIFDALSAKLWRVTTTPVTDEMPVL